VTHPINRQRAELLAEITSDVAERLNDGVASFQVVNGQLIGRANDQQIGRQRLQKLSVHKGNGSDGCGGAMGKQLINHQ
jgi:hypothetical protein